MLSFSSILKNWQKFEWGLKLLLKILNPFDLMTISAHLERLFVLWQTPIRQFYFVRFLFRIYTLLLYISHRETLCTICTCQLDNFIRFLFHICTLLLYISHTFRIPTLFTHFYFTLIYKPDAEYLSYPWWCRRSAKAWILKDLEFLTVVLGLIRTSVSLL